MTSRTQRNVVPANDSRRRRMAPDVAEESPRRMAPALVGETAETIAQGLAADPEFREWVGAEFAADLAHKTATAHR